MYKFRSFLSKRRSKFYNRNLSEDYHILKSKQSEMDVLKSIGNGYFMGSPTTLLPILTNANVFNFKTLANLKIKMKKYKSGCGKKEKSRREAENKLKML